MASIRGRVFALADPADERFAPTPDEILILSVASDLAWSARSFLRTRELEADVNVTATWQTAEHPPRLADVTMTVTVPATAETINTALRSALEQRAAARSLDGSPRVKLQQPDARE
jgi:uncharacterized OsmC-like protein